MTTVSSSEQIRETLALGDALAAERAHEVVDAASGDTLHVRPRRMMSRRMVFDAAVV